MVQCFANASGRRPSAPEATLTEGARAMQLLQSDGRGSDNGLKPTQQAGAA